MPVRTADAEWTGTLKEGSGHMRMGGGSYDGAYTFASRFEEGEGTNPEELIAAAHAGCFSMALSAGLTRAGHAPTRIQTTARVHLEKRGEAFEITRIELATRGRVPGIDEAEFRRQAETAKANCPVSKALAGSAISLEVAFEPS
jgi:osmotically inducible protein OsmC